MEGYIIANKSCNSSCPQFSWLGDECITWEMVIYILEVVGASEERGARGTHATEVGSSSLACLSRALRSLQRVTPKRLLRGLAIRQSLMVLLKFRYKEKKILKMYNEIMGKTFPEDPIRTLNLFDGAKKSLQLARCQSFPKTS